MLKVDSICFDPPAGFATLETTVSLRALGEGNGWAPRTSMVAHVTPARAGASLPELAGEMTADLTRGVPGMRDLTTAELQFRDGAAGILLAYTLSAGPAGSLRQYHALRLDEGRLSTLTLTVPVSTLNETTAQLYVEALASMRRAN
jgi:hypothetical protein